MTLYDALVYFFTLFSENSFPNRPFPNGDMWNPQRFTCSWSWMISRKAHPPWAPSLAGFPQWLGVSNPDVFWESSFPRRFLADENAGWYLVQRSPGIFLVAQKFWRHLFAEEPIFGHFSHFGRHCFEDFCARPLRASRKSYTWESWALVLFEVRS